MSILIVYHSACPDGFTAAAIAHYALEYLNKKQVEYYPITPNFKQSIHDIEAFCKKYANREILVFDVAFSKDQCRAMIETYGISLAIYDHHQSSYLELNGESYFHYDANESGASLAWKYFFPNIAVPDFVDNIRKKDLYIHRDDHQATCFTLYWNTVTNFRSTESFTNYMMLLQNPAYYQLCIKKGETMLQEEQKILNKIGSTSCKGKISVLGKNYAVCMVNSSDLISELGEHLSKDVDLVIVWRYAYDKSAKRYRYILSLRSQKIDVEDLAFKWVGGGGHPGAAGGAIDAFPPSLLEEKTPGTDTDTVEPTGLMTQSLIHNSIIPFVSRLHNRSVTIANRNLNSQLVLQHAMKQKNRPCDAHIVWYFNHTTWKYEVKVLSQMNQYHTQNFIKSFEPETTNFDIRSQIMHMVCKKKIL